MLSLFDDVFVSPVDSQVKDEEEKEPILCRECSMVLENEEVIICPSCKTYVDPEKEIEMVENQYVYDDAAHEMPYVDEYTHLARMVAIDREGKAVMLDDDTVLPYDRLVLATGLSEASRQYVDEMEQSSEDPQQDPDQDMNITAFDSKITRQTNSMCTFTDTSC